MKPEASLSQQMEQAVVRLNTAVIQHLLSKGMAPLDTVPDTGLTVVELGMTWLSTDRAALYALLEQMPAGQRNAMAGKLYAAANTRGNALAFDSLLHWGVPVNRKAINGILPCVLDLAEQGQADAVKTYLRIYQRLRSARPPDLSDALLAAARQGHVACLEVLLEFFDVQDDTHFAQLSRALEAAACENRMPAAKAIIDWLKCTDAFDEENIFPLEESMVNLPDHALFCLAEAGYIFASESFPLERDEKIGAALQDILFGKDLALSPLSRLCNAHIVDLMNVWHCIIQSETLNHKNNFAFKLTCAELMLLGFRKPVASWLTNVLYTCSPDGRQNASIPNKLSAMQAHMLGIFLLNELQLIPPELQSDDPLVAVQCRLLVDVAQHCINAQFDTPENFFSKCINSVQKNLTVDTVWLNKFLRHQLGLPDSLIKHIDSALASALNEGLNLPAIPFAMQGKTCQQVHEIIEMQVLHNVLRWMPKKLLAVLDSHALRADANAAEFLDSSGFIIYEGGAHALIRLFCQKMQVLIDEGRERIQKIQIRNDSSATDSSSGSDEASDSGSDSEE